MSQLKLDRAVQADSIVGSRMFRRLYSRRERVRWGLAGAAFAIAGVFTACMCLAPEFIASPISAGSGVTWGIVLTLLSFALGTGVGAVYVVAAERLLGGEELKDWRNNDS